MASDGADAARQAIRSRALKYELAINLNTALGREVLMLLAKTFAPRLLRRMSQLVHQAYIELAALDVGHRG